jgi:regulatory protein
MASDTPREKLVRTAKNYAVASLEKTQMTEDQLRRKLATKLARRFATEDGDEDPDRFVDVIDEVVRLCVDYSFIDDAAYAGRKAEAAVRKGQSSHRASMEMHAKGVPATLAAQALEDYDALLAALNYMRRKRSGPFTPPDETPERKQKRIAGFMRQGFSWSLWGTACAMTAEEAEDYLAGRSEDTSS